MSLRAAFKGWFGELLVTATSNITLDGDIYQSVNNVTIPTSNGTTQIDHIIVSRYGIFVIETKNMEGWIFGDADRPKWTQSFRKSRFQFQNPLHQNYRHIKSLAEFLGIPTSSFISLVCFVGAACELKSSMPPNVIRGVPFGYIKKQTTVILSDESVPKIVQAIKSGMRPKNILGLSTVATKNEHLASLANRHSSKTNCPKCGSELKEKTANSGSNIGNTFMACSRFPSCRYTKDIPRLFIHKGN